MDLDRCSQLGSNTPHGRTQANLSRPELRPLDGRCAWLPGSGDTAAGLSQGVAVVGELDLEGKLFARVAAGVVYPLASDGERA
jgi:hypothetical protein